MYKSPENNSQLVRDAATGELYRVGKRYPRTYSDLNQQLLEQASSRRQKAKKPEYDTGDFFGYQYEPSSSKERRNLNGLFKVIGVACIFVYGTSVVIHPSEGLRSPSEYAQTWQKIGKMAADNIGITDPNNNQPNTGDETNE